MGEDNKVGTLNSHSILEMLEQVMLQVEYRCFAHLRFNWIDPFYKELCLIIAEVFLLNPDSVVKINGTNLPTILVQEIYSQLRNDHLCLVFENFKNVSTRIYNKKAYLRTALYNSVFEHFASYTNDINIG